jgi:hypothetical protein
MDATDQIRNDQEIVIRAGMLSVEKAQMFVNNQGGHSENACHM